MIKLNLKGFRQLRTSAKMDALVLGMAEKVAAAAGPDYKAELSPGRNRSRAVVTPDSARAALETASEPARLISALNAARR